MKKLHKIKNWFRINWAWFTTQRMPVQYVVDFKKIKSKRCIILIDGASSKQIKQFMNRFKEVNKNSPKFKGIITNRKVEVFEL